MSGVSARVVRYFPRIVSVIVVAGAVHGLLAEALIGPLVSDALVLKPIRAALILAIAISIVVQLVVAWTGAANRGPDHVTRDVPRVTRFLTPPTTAVALFVLWPVSQGGAAVPPVWGAEAGLALVVALATSLLVGIFQKRVLNAIGVRVRTGPDTTVLREAQTASVSGTYARTLAGAAVACFLLVGAGAFATGVRVEYLSAFDLLMAGFGSMAMVAVAAAAGQSLGQSTGKDVVAIARRLDALGYNSRQSMDFPVRVTSFDDIGVLFLRIEHLRKHLGEEVALYQDALDRTRDADASKAAFLAAVSHELRTPLNSIIGFADLCLSGVAGPLTDPQADDIRLIKAAGHQLLGLITDILDISMIESGELSLSFDEVTIADIVEGAVQIHRPLLRDKDVTLQSEVGRNLPTVMCDRRRIGQVLNNLVSNAIKFTDEGSITVRAKHTLGSETVDIEVVDTGVGIESDELATIFEEYRQVGSLKKRAKGTGLGLAIARSIATHHGGMLAATSVAGEGSTFVLSLPVRPTRQPSMIDMTEERARAIAKIHAETGLEPADLIAGKAPI